MAGRTGIRGRRVRLAAVLAAVCVPVEPQAHESQTPVHYVAAHGRDEGACADRAQPCLTIPYALTHTEKGDEVRVAGGIFDFRPQDPAEVIQLLNFITPVRGSFDAGFAVQNVADTPTILRGPSESDARALEQRGLLVAREGPRSTPAVARRQGQSRGPIRHVTPDGRNDGGCTREAPCALSHPGHRLRAGAGRCR